jgi:hypothetical protein
MNICIYCSSSTQGKVCMAKNCQNKKKKQHYHDNIDRYHEVKKAEYKRNYKQRAPRSKERRAKRYYKDFIETALRTVKSRAKEYSMDFDLDKLFLTELYEKQSKKCALTGLEFEVEREVEYRKRRPFAPSIDRIDYKKGYTKNNVRLVCVAVNIALSDFGDEVFDKMCLAYVNHKQRNQHAN